MSHRLVALAAVLVLALAGVARADGTYTFDMTADFAPNNDLSAPSNPFGSVAYSSYGFTTLWTYMQGVTASHASGNGAGNPTAYQSLNLPTSTTLTPFPPSGPTMPAVVGSEVSIADQTRRPYFVENSGPGAQVYANATFAVHKVVVSPGASQNAIIAFKVPVAGTWSLTGSLADAAPSCGNGIDYWIDKNAANLINGTTANGFSPADLAAAGDTNIALTTSDTIYLTLGAKAADAACDATTVILNMVLNDGAAPTPDISATSPPARTKTNDPVFSGTIPNAFGDAAAATIEVLDNTSAVVRTLPAHVTGTNWTTVWSEATPSNAVLPDGDYTVRVTQADTASPPNSGTSAARPLTVDNVAPTVTLTGGPTGSIKTQPTPNWSGAASTDPDASSTVTLKIYSDATLTNEVRSIAGTASAGSYSIAFSGGNLPDGNYWAQAEQNDTAAPVPNTGKSASRAFTIDTVNPTPTITNPSSGETIADDTPALAGTLGTASGDASTVTVTVHAGPGVGTLQDTPTVSYGSGTWSATSAALADGAHTIKVTQTDAAGNSGTSTVEFTLDTSGPDVTLVGPTTPTADTTPSFSGVAGIAVGDGNVRVKVYPGLAATGTDTYESTQQIAVPNPITGAWSVTDAPALADGFYTAQALQTDLAAHTGRSDPVTFHVDLNAPAVTITTPTASALLPDDTPTISGAAGNISDDNATITVKVYSGPNTSGTLLQTISTSRTGASWSQSLAPLPDGQYTVQAEQGDAIGHTGTSNTRTFTIDATKPTVSLDNPSDGAVTSNTTPTVNGTMSESGLPVSVKVYRGDDPGGTLVQTRPMDVSGTTYTRQLLPLSDGTYTLQAEHTDAAGNVGQSTEAPTIRIDTTAPTVALTAPTAGAVTSDTTPTIAGTAGTATGDPGTVSVKIYVGPAVTVSALQTLTPSVTSGAFTVDTAALSPGTYTAQATQTDSAGNPGVSNARTFEVDTTTPAPTLTAVTTPTSNRRPTFSGVGGTAAHDPTSVTVNVYEGSIVGGTPARSFTAPLGSGGAYSASLPTSLAQLDEGTYTAQTDQTDTANHRGTSPTRTFVVDATAPTVTFTQPTASGNDTTPTLSGTAGHAAGEGNVTVNVYSGTSATGTPAQTLSATPNGSGAWTVDASPALGDGTYTAVASQSDNATPANTGTSPERTFRIDTAAPAPTIASPASGATIAGSTPTLTGTAGHGTGDGATTTIKLYAGSAATGTPVQTLTAPVGADGSWAALGSGALADGTYTAQATQSDDAGNSGSSAARTFVVQIVPPDTTKPTGGISLPIQRVRRIVRTFILNADITVSEPSNVLIVAAISKATARKLGYKAAPMASNPKFVAIGQAVATNKNGSSREKVFLTKAAVKALKRVRAITITAFAAVVDLAGNRTDARTAARLIR